MRRKIGFVGLALVVAIGLAFWLWPRPQSKNLLLVTLDTTRADRLACYGYAAGRTPVLDQLAASGILFERATTVAPCTLPAHTSLFTGLYPAENGVSTNGRGRLDGAIPTLAAVLQRRGYQTAAFVGAFVLNGKFGLDQGFETYDDDFVSEEPALDAFHRLRHGASVVDAALRWLGARQSRPFFCWVHLYDPHEPYLAHAELFGDAFADRPYDAEIAYVDRQVGRLIDFLKTSGLDEETLVVVVGDHGEAFGEHLERGHGITLYQEAMHVPLIFRHPGRLAAGRRVEGPVSLVDVSPTVLDLLGIADERKITGRSVAQALRGGDLRASPCYGATDEAFLKNGWSPLRSLTDGTWKYIRTTQVELYDLATDPGERENLAATRPDQVQAMASRMADLESRLIPRSETQVQLSPAERRALASLGYAAGLHQLPEGPAPADLPDIKEMLRLDLAADRAAELLAAGEEDAGIEKLQEIIRQAPGLTKAYWNLAMALRQRSQFDEAAQVFRELLAVKPDCREGHNGLGILALDQGRFDNAIAEFLKTVDVDPDFADAHYNLAVVYLRQGNQAEALWHLNALLEIDTCHVAGYDLRGDVLARLGRKDEAAADYRKALKYAPPPE
ncbi:MAG: tetratricopeptide repeat protein [Planctomycetaceae bacterium]|nr:tetratricopeptide repeat protein [Planctomycetaceae bacterium]